MVYTLTLNSALDYDIYLDKFKNGSLNIASNINLRAGGKGINVSFMLKNLKIDNIAMGIYSGFLGEFISKKLEEQKISNFFIKTPGNTRINVKINDKYTQTEIAGISDTLDPKYFDEILTKIKTLDENDILVLSGSIPKAIPTDIYKQIAKSTKAKTILDTRGKLILDNIYSNILVKPNIKELEDAFNINIENESQIIEYANKLLDMNVQNVIVSNSSNGAILINKKSILKASIPKGKYINSIGSGDSMVAGFIYAYINNMSDEKKLRYAVACGSATAYSYEIGNLNTVNSLLEDIKIKEV